MTISFEGRVAIVTGGTPAEFAATTVTSSLSFSSSSRRSAVFLPMPGTLMRRALSCVLTASYKSPILMPESTDNAVRAPTPEIFSNWRKTWRSCSLAKP